MNAFTPTVLYCVASVLSWVTMTLSWVTTAYTPAVLDNAMNAYTPTVLDKAMNVYTPTVLRWAMTACTPAQCCFAWWLGMVTTGADNSSFGLWLMGVTSPLSVMLVCTIDVQTSWCKHAPAQLLVPEPQYSPVTLPYLFIIYLIIYYLFPAIQPCDTALFTTASYIIALITTASYTFALCTTASSIIALLISAWLPLTPISLLSWFLPGSHCLL